MVSPEVRQEVEKLVYLDMKLLDERRYIDWLNLYSKRCTYWMPLWVSDYGVTEDPRTQLSYLNLDRGGLEVYVKRLLSDSAHAYEPPPKITRIASNLLVEDGEDGTIRVMGKWLVHMWKKGLQLILSGDVEYKVVREDGTLKILSKKVTVASDNIPGGQLPII